MAIFKVAAHTGDNNNGYIEYDTETKELGVHQIGRASCRERV